LFTSFLASVFLGKDIRTGTDIALKIGHADHMPSRSVMNMMYIKQSPAPQVSLQSAGLEKKAFTKLSFWIILELHLVI